MSETIAGVSVIVCRKEHYLLVRRARPPFEGKLAFPGGRVAHGETLEQAARRELFEETALTAKTMTPVDNFIIEAGAARFHLHVFVTEASGEERAGDDAASIEWLDLAEMEANGESVTADTLRLARKFATDR
ncbi:NUDIX hydrolase [Notoacmeibacter sp. MSK16QG-6]|uniref:NUDIX hydrolase n=1 Tax=Notoacmeibacter sp. MSK16QG-6 TaxID=2957982 RepID=UPI0020A0F4AE|nr:NUDIX domain-containing protein [Notoacmeibacter sp. MSK16QG-6]MCP1198021.1 NUDIX domain-containing protein [Notoacmeibacter sp. MSK16QG-6]